jgi:hypothetical protein
MKALMLLFSVGISFAAFTQTKQDFQPNYDRLKGFVHPVPTPPQKNMKPLLKHLNMQVDSARYVGSNHLGEIYTLPQDNMPMLKPYVNGEALMPGTQVTVVQTQPNMAGKIPNAVPEKKLVIPAPPARK